jgi:hypothetical protein
MGRQRSRGRRSREWRHGTSSAVPFASTRSG